MTLYDQTVHNYVFSVIIMYGFRLLYDFFMTFLYINSCQLGLKMHLLVLLVIIVDFLHFLWYDAITFERKS